MEFLDHSTFDNGQVELLSQCMAIAIVTQSIYNLTLVRAAHRRV